MKYSLAINEQAHRDIERNAVWWATHHSLDQAIRWSDEVYRQLSTLRTMPLRHGLASENDRFPYELRQQLVGLGDRPVYRAVYTIHDDTVYVLTVRRGSQERIGADELPERID
jgi:hypothetical protein